MTAHTDPRELMSALTDGQLPGDDVSKVLDACRQDAGVMESLTIGGLAGRLSLEPSTITPLVKRLEVAGLVARTRNQADEREVRVSLTEAGRDVMARSSCLAEALLAKSDMAISDLGRLRDLVRQFRTKVAT